MNIPLPHRYDRYRLLGLLVRHKGSTQQILASQLDQHQSTVSRWFSLNALEEKSLMQFSFRRPGLLKFAAQALHLSYREVCLFLWLATGTNFTPPTKKEILEHGLHATKKDIEESKLFQKEPNRAYWAAIDWIKSSIARPGVNTAIFEVKSVLLHGNSPASRIEFYRKLLEIEARPGQRMLVSKFPSILMSADLTEFSDRTLSLPEPHARTLQKMLIRRHEVFKRNIEEYGERVIHSTSSLRRFLNPGFVHPVEWTERCNRVRSLIDHLRSFKKFHVGLSEVEPEVEIAIKSTEAAMIRGTARELSNHPKTIFLWT